jgi:hypothetical protein
MLKLTKCSVALALGLVLSLALLTTSSFAQSAYHTTNQVTQTTARTAWGGWGWGGWGWGGWGWGYPMYRMYGGWGGWGGWGGCCSCCW